MFAKLRVLTAGESHGPALVVILEGIPSGLHLKPEDVNHDLARRQRSYGRGLRSKEIESDRVRFLSGVRHGITTGSPIAMVIENRDFENWQQAMSPNPLDEIVPEEKLRSFFVPRPGHADLAGAVKFLTKDMRPILERASARETAARVAAGAVAKKFLSEIGVKITSHVVAIGNAIANVDASQLTLVEIEERAKASEVRCLDKEAESAMKQLIDKAASEGDTLGGIFEVIVEGAPVGLGSHVQWDKKLDGRLAQAVMSIPAIKGVEIGKAFELSQKFGSQVHDPFLTPNPNATDWRFFPRASNNAGGVEGGITNGERIVVRGAMKPIPTLRNPLPSVDVRTLQPARAHVERSDVCAVPAAAVVAEAMVALVIADAVLEKFGGDSMEELKANIDSFRKSIRSWMVGDESKCCS